MGGTFPRGSTAITGRATYGVGEAPGHTSLELAAKASMLAIADAGLRLGDVDGLFICLPDDFFAGLSLAEYLGLQQIGRASCRERVLAVRVDLGGRRVIKKKKIKS